MIAGIINTEPVAVFAFEDGSYEFEIEEPGYYSISILGAGFIQSAQPASIKLISDKGEELEVNTHKFAPRFNKHGKIGIERWGFSIEDTGRFTLSCSNLKNLVAKESMLASGRSIESPAKHDKLRVIIHRSIKPVHKLLYLLLFIIGIGLLTVGLLYYSHQNDLAQVDNRIDALIKSNEPNKLAEAFYLIGENNMFQYVPELLRDPGDPRISHDLRFKGMSVYQAKMVALKKMSGLVPPTQITQEPDTSVINFYSRWAKRKIYTTRE